LCCSYFVLETPITITPYAERFGNPVGTIKGFGYSFSSNTKDMNGDQTPEFAIGAVSKDGDHVALLVRSRPTVYIESAGKTFAQSVIDPKVTGNPWFVIWEILSIHLIIV
jgi:hypothetical protein